MALLHGAFWGGACSALRGFSMMASVTAAFAYITEIVPEGRSVSAVSSLGMIANVAFAFAPALTVVFWNHGVGREMFAYGALATLVGAVPLTLLPARHDVRSGRRSRTILMRSKWLPAMTFLVAAALQSGVNGSIAVLTFAHRGVANGALIFTSMALMTFALRYPASRFVEKYGARLMAIPVAVFQIAGCLLAAHPSSAASVLLAGAFLGMGWSAIVPVGIGLFFEHSSRRTRGVAMGSYSLSFAVGMSGGSVARCVLHAFWFWLRRGDDRLCVRGDVSVAVGALGVSQQRANLRRVVAT
ncbi:MAG: MFS transporter [Candidatus Eremiobacteraeota bacterium]|nr:MFS transporter [Candidatus Eremiobacteraeota bacterium]